MIQRSKNRPNVKKILIAIFLILIPLISFLCYSYSTGNMWPFSTEDYSTNQTGAESNKPKAIGDTPAPGETKNPDKTPVQYESPSGGSGQPSPSLTGAISYKSIKNGVLSIRITINQTLTQGICKLSLRNRSSGRLIQSQAEIIANPSSSTCKGFDTPVSGMDSGNWDITVEIESGNRTGNIIGQVAI